MRIDAYRDEAVYEKGIKVSDDQMEKLNLTKSTDLGQWNYTVTPAQVARLEQEQALQTQMRAA